MIGKAPSDELSCPCDRFCCALSVNAHLQLIYEVVNCRATPNEGPQTHIFMENGQKSLQIYLSWYMTLIQTFVVVEWMLHHLMSR